MKLTKDMSRAELLKCRRELQSTALLEKLPFLQKKLAEINQALAYADNRKEAGIGKTDFKRMDLSIDNYEKNRQYLTKEIQNGYDKTVADFSGKTREELIKLYKTRRPKQGSHGYSGTYYGMGIRKAIQENWPFLFNLHDVNTRARAQSNRERREDSLNDENHTY